MLVMTPERMLRFTRHYKDYARETGKIFIMFCIGVHVHVHLCRKLPK